MAIEKEVSVEEESFGNYRIHVKLYDGERSSAFSYTVFDDVLDKDELIEAVEGILSKMVEDGLDMSDIRDEFAGDVGYKDEECSAKKSEGKNWRGSLLQKISELRDAAEFYDVVKSGVEDILWYLNASPDKPNKAEVVVDDYALLDGSQEAQVDFAIEQDGKAIDTFRAYFDAVHGADEVKFKVGDRMITIGPDKDLQDLEREAHFAGWGTED